MSEIRRFLELSQQAQVRGDLKAALEYQLKFIDSFKPENDDDLIFLSKNYVRLSDLMLKNGYLPKAILFLEKALKIQQRLLPEDDLTIVQTLKLLIQAYLANFYVDKALTAALKATEILQKYPVPNDDLAQIYSWLAIIYENLEQLEKAQNYAQKALDTYSNRHSSQYVEALINLANIYLENDQTQQACELLNRAFEILKSLDFNGSSLIEQAKMLYETCS